MNKKLPRWLIWVLAIALLAFIGLAAGLAVTTFRQRTDETARRAWTPAALTPAPATSQTSVHTPIPPTPTSSATVATLTAESPTATPSPSPVPPAPTSPPPLACSMLVAPEMLDLFDAALLGCPTGPVAVVWAAWEPFERGAMLWRSDNDSAYALFADDGWLEIAEHWSGQYPEDRGMPPPGLLAPDRGFGWVWSTRDDLVAGLGWALEPEKGFCAARQPFERGFLLRSSGVASCTPDNLYNHAAAPDWQPINLALYADGWRRTGQN